VILMVACSDERITTHDTDIDSADATGFESTDSLIGHSWRFEIRRA
jgi:hypothetical protein